jgi:hypothetical protein
MKARFMRVLKQDGLRVIMLLWVVGTITVALQAYVGDVTVYSEGLEQKRIETHRAILANEPPGGGSWAAVGRSTANIRVGTVYLAEGIHRATGVPVTEVYRQLDTFCLFAALVGLFFYLRLWVTDTYCLIGLLYFCSMLPLTYFLYFFHPWDRIQLAMWILLLYLVWKRRPVLLGVCLAASIVVKFDSILLPALYFAVHTSRDHWRRALIESGGLFAVAVCTYLGLRWAFPAPLEPPKFTPDAAWRQVQTNIDALILMKYRYPPLLMHALPVVLSIVGIRTRQRFLWTSVLFAGALSVIWFLFTNYQEVRAQLVVLVLVLPASLLSLRDLLERRGRASSRSPVKSSARSTAYATGEGRSPSGSDP